MFEDVLLLMFNVMMLMLSSLLYGEVRGAIFESNILINQNYTMKSFWLLLKH